MTGANDLWQHTVKQLKFAGHLIDVVAQVRWLMPFEQIRVIADLSQLHDGVLKGRWSLPRL